MPWDTKLIRASHFGTSSPVRPARRPPAFPEAIPPPPPRFCNHPRSVLIPSRVYAAVMWVVSGVFLALWIGLYLIERRPGGFVQGFLVVAICVALLNWVAHYRWKGD